MQTLRLRLTKVLFQCLQICHANPAKHRFVMHYVSDAHVAFICQRHRNDILSIELLVDDTAADRIPVQTNQQIKQCRSVTDTNVFLSL